MNSPVESVGNTRLRSKIGKPNRQGKEKVSGVGIENLLSQSKQHPMPRDAEVQVLPEKLHHLDPRICEEPLLEVQV
jgi:hypothetical protein